jgi:hypothetical protein
MEIITCSNILFFHPTPFLSNFHSHLFFIWLHLPSKSLKKALDHQKKKVGSDSIQFPDFANIGLGLLIMFKLRK